MEKKQVIDEVKKLKKKVRIFKVGKIYSTPSWRDTGYNEAIEDVLNLLREY